MDDLPLQVAEVHHIEVDHPDSTDASRRQIDRLVTEMFGPAMRYDLELVDLIPQEPSGKYRFCISKVAHDHLGALPA